MRIFWRVAFLAFLALSCVLLGLTIRVSFDWSSLSGATRTLDRDEVAALRTDLSGVRDPFESVIKVAKVMAPSVVSIEVVPRPRSQGVYVRTVPRGGSGILLDDSGHILTNWHVIGDPSPYRIQVQQGRQRTLEASLVGWDQFTDLAVIKVDAEGLVPAVLGDSDAVEVGQAAIAIGSPFALQGTVTLGMISTTARDVNTGDRMADVLGVESYIQTDAAINPGNSGGPLVDIHGNVIGVNTMIVTRTSAGVGFAIPINYAKQIADAIIENRVQGEAPRGGLGIRLSETDDRYQREGALVELVGPLTPADRAGFEPGDLVVEYGNRRIREGRELIQQVQKTPEGTQVPVVVLRDNRYVTLHPVIGNRNRATEGLIADEEEARTQRRQ